MELKNFYVQDQDGNAQPGIPCYLYLAGTDTLATVVLDASGIQKTNPFNTDVYGLAQFKAPDGEYDLRVVSETRDYRIRLQCVDSLGAVEAIEEIRIAKEVAVDSAASALDSKTAANTLLINTQDIVSQAQTSMDAKVNSAQGYAAASQTSAQQAATSALAAATSASEANVIVATAFDSLLEPTGSAKVGYKGRTVEARLSERISASDYLVGRNPTQAIQQAIESALLLGGARVFIPDGLWQMTETINMRSGVEVECGPNAVLDWTNVTGQSAVAFSGSIGPEVAISAPVTRGDTTINTVSSHGIVAGDLFQIKGQRNALSVDAGDQWRIGFGTPSAPCCYYSEFLFAESVTGTSVKASCGLMFPNYRQDSTLETDVNARPSTTVAKLTPIKDSIWSGGKFINMSSTLNSAFRSNWAYNCRVVGVEVDKAANQGSAVFWVNSFHCKAFDVVCRTDPATVIPDADHAKYNRFKVAGGQSCWFEGCEDHNGSQPFDFSYFNLSTPSVQCGVRNCTTIGARKNAMTSHPGSYMIDVINNHFLQCGEDGIAIRSRKGKIIGNTLTGTTESDTSKLSYALSAYEGWGRDNLFEGNIVDGFYYGIYEWDGADVQEQFSYSGNMYKNNIFDNVSYGAFVDPNALSRNVVYRSTVIEGNTFKNVLQKFLNVDPYAPGVVFSRNQCYGPLGSPGQACVVSGNSPGFQAEGNKFYNLGTGVVPIGMGQITDTTVYPTATWNYTTVVRLNDTFGAAGVMSVYRDQVRPSFVEQAGRVGAVFLPDSVAAPNVLPGYAMLYIDSTDRTLKLKFGDAVTNVISAHP